MQTAGASELGYASAAILGALMDWLVIRGTLKPDDASGVLADADRTLASLGNLTSIPGARRVIGDVKAQLAKHGVS
jgi:hypothetical protein